MFRVGVHLQSKMSGQRDWDGREKDHFFNEFIPALKPDYSLVLDEWKWGIDIRPHVRRGTILRISRDDEGKLYEVMSPKQFYDTYAGLADKGFILNVLNEPNGYRDGGGVNLGVQARWLADVAALFGKRGLPLVLGNWAVGHPDEYHFSDFQPLWDALMLYPIHFAGLHLYWSYKGIEFNNGRVGRIQWLSDYWQRSGWGGIQALITEFGIDAIDNTNKRAWQDSRTESEYADEIKAACRMMPPCVKGAMIYCYGNTGRKGTAGDWDRYDISKALNLHTALIAMNAGVSDAPPVEPPPPVIEPPAPPETAPGQPATADFIPALAPAGSSWQAVDRTYELLPELRPLAVVVTAPNGLNLRATPSTKGTVFATLAPGGSSVVILLPGAIIEADGFKWAAVAAGVSIENKVYIALLKELWFTPLDSPTLKAIFAELDNLTGSADRLKKGLAGLFPYLGL